MTAIRLRNWASHLFAYAFSTTFLFGLAALLNTVGLEFFFNYPRTVQVTLIDSRLDVLVWAVSAISFSALVIWSSKGRPFRLIQTVIALIAMILSATLLSTLETNFTRSVITYLLFVLVTGEFISLVPWRTDNSEKQLRISSILVAIYILAYFAVIEISSGIHWVIRSLGSTNQIGSIDAAIELNFSYVPYALIPWLYLGFLSSWAWVPLVWKLISRNRMMQSMLGEDSGESGSLLAETASIGKLSILFDPRLFLVLSVVIFVGYYPYFQNPPWLVGTDAYWRYFGPLTTMGTKGVFGGFVEALAERHPLPLMLLYAAHLVFHTTAFAVVKFTPIFLTATLAFFTSLFLAKRKKMNFGLIVFLLSTLSVTTAVGLYSSILANWMALVCWMVFFAFVGLRGDEKFRARDLVLLLAISTLVLLLHPWTWGVFAAAVIIAAVVTFLERARGLRRPAAIVLLVVAADAVLAFLSITLLAGSQGWREVEAIDLYTYVIRNPSTVFFFWDAVKRLTEIWSPFFSPLYIAVSILGVLCLRVSNLTPWRRNLILGWLCISALGSILVAPIGFDPAQPTLTESQLWRLFFLTPFYLTAPFGITWLAQLPSHFRSILGSKPNMDDLVGSHRVLWLGSLLGLGILIAWLPIWTRAVLLLVALPLSTAMLLLRCRGAEHQFLSDIIMATFVLVAFNSIARSLSQLLIDPHSAFRSS
jgi:hypothetical protein